MRVVILLVVLGSLTACAVSPKALNRVSIGMTKAEVIQTIGEPDETVAQRSVEYLKYRWWDQVTLWTDPTYDGDFFFVRLVNGHVEAYGRQGDFDSTKDPTINVNSTIRHQ